MEVQYGMFLLAQVPWLPEFCLDMMLLHTLLNHLPVGIAAYRRIVKDVHRLPFAGRDLSRSDMSAWRCHAIFMPIQQEWC